MGWKNVKQRYAPDLPVWVDVVTGYVNFGRVNYASAMVVSDHSWKEDSDRMVLGMWPTDVGEHLTVWRFSSSRDRVGEEEHNRIAHEIRRDPGLYLQLLKAPDIFGRKIPIFAWDMNGNIVLDYCEDVGFPNVTFAGRLMRDGSYSTDYDEAVDLAIDDMENHTDIMVDEIDEISEHLAEVIASLNRCRAAKERLEKLRDLREDDGRTSPAQRATASDAALKDDEEANGGE